MGKPKLLDLFCGAGGASMGYYRAGFEVVGVDKKPQPHYPFPFIIGDTFDILNLMLNGQVKSQGRGFYEWYGIKDFDAIHASPPCQFGSQLTEKKYRGNHPNYIPLCRARLIAIGKPFVIENVRGSHKHLINPIMLCGSMFGLEVWRHRYFETNPQLNWLTIKCNHSNIPVLISGSPRRNGVRTEPSTERRREAMGIDWMTRKELDEAIPPTYTEYIGKYLMAILPKPSPSTTPPPGYSSKK